MENNYMIIFFIVCQLTYCVCATATVYPQRVDILQHQNWPKDTHDICGISYADRIIGGINASLGQYPWLARIGYNSQYI